MPTTNNNALINLGDDNDSALPMRVIDKSFDFEMKDFDEADRSFTAVASTSTIDRDGDILEARGWKLKNYKKNPLLLWNHRADMPPIGKSKETRVENDRLMFTPQFMPAEVNQFSEQIFRMFKGGWLRSFSVRFDPIKWEDRKPEEGKGSGEAYAARFGRVFTSLELLEVSAVNIPANPEALKAPQMLNFVVKSFLNEHAGMIPDAAERQKLYSFEGSLVAPAMIKEAAKEVAESSNAIKEKVEKLKALTNEKNLLVTRAEQAKIEVELDSQIKQLEQFLHEQQALSVVEGVIKNIQDGITVLKKS